MNSRENKAKSWFFEMIIKRWETPGKTDKEKWENINDLYQE